MKLIVFDWDGTLADSVSKIFECKQFLAKKHNLPIPSEQTVKHALGKKFEDAMSLCFPSLERHMLEKLGNEFHELMQTEIYQAALFPDVRQVLDQLKVVGFKLAIATSKHTKELETAISYHHLEGLFDIICCGIDYKNKPDPAMLCHIMDYTGIALDEAVMIGDTTTDICFAKNAGVAVVAVTYGAHAKEELQLASPDYLLDDLGQLPTLVETLCCSTKISCRS